MMRCNNKIIRSVTVSQSVGFISGIIPSLSSNGYEVIVVSSPGEELRWLKGEGVRCFEVPMERRFAIRKDIVALFRLVRLFRRERPYMVHSMTPKAGLLCMMAAWFCRVPRRVHTFTGLVWPTAKGIVRRLLIATDWITCYCATNIIPEGVGVMNDLLAHVTNKPMRVLGFGNVKGVDMVRFSCRPEVVRKAQELRRDGFVFFYVGRIAGDKGINELVEAFVKVLEAHPDARLELAGGLEDGIDPLRARTMQWMQSNKRIELVGNVYGDDLVAYYAASDCFVFPSYREGFPNAVLEAGAMGLPCIVTDINGSREIVENEKNGLVVPAKDANALYSAMKRIIESSELRGRLKSNSRSMIASRYEQDYVRRCLLEFYESIM